MRIFYIFFLLSILILPNITLAETFSKDFSTIGSWKITAEGEAWSPKTKRCRATGEFGKNHLELLQGDLIPSGYGGMLLYLTMHQQQLPKNYQGSVNLAIDGRVVASGVLTDISDWHNNKRKTFYASATFEKIERLTENFQASKKLTIVGDRRVFKPIVLDKLNLNIVMKELQRCLQ
jgi:hypothetical protein